MTPSRRDRLKPVEYLGFAGVIGLFAGIVTLIVVREPVTAAILGGVAFIVTLVLIATLTLAVHPPKEGERDRDDEGPRGH